MTQDQHRQQIPTLEDIREAYLEDVLDAYWEDVNDTPTYAMLADMRDRALFAERELSAVTEQRDRLAVVLQNIRSGYGGQIPDPTCDCGDCEFLIKIDNALQYLKPN